MNDALTHMEDRKARNRIATAKWRAANPNYHKEYNRNRRVGTSEYNKRYYVENKERFLEYREINKERISKYEKKRRDETRYGKKYRKENLAQYSAYSAKRRAAKLYRTPKWVDLEKIENFYIEAKRLTEETGIQHHVDHIIPLQGKKVSGLHVENNLQILIAVENIKKNNKFEGITNEKL